MGFQHHLREWLKAVSLIGLAFVLGWCALKVTWSITGTMKELTVTEGSLNDTLAKVNRPCSPGPCGTLAEVNKAAVKLQDVTVTLQRQVSQSSKMVDATTADLDRTSDSLNLELDSLRKTTDAAAGMTVALTADAQTLKPSLEAFPPLLESTNAAVVNFNDLLLAPSLKDTMEHVNGMSASGDKMLADAQWKEHELLHPTKAKGFKAFLGGMVLWIHRLMPPIF